jgi:threonine dehydrogenase-like Zn-dependent dehydrogenase
MGDMALKMKVPYMMGSFDADFTYGYSLVGEVIAGDPEWTGRFVHIMHPHQDMVLVKKEDVFPIPGNISPQKATLASNLETIVNAIWDSNVTVGDRVLIVGFGIIGALLASALNQIPGVGVVIHENDPERIQYARSLGFLIAHDKADLPKDFTISYNTTGSESGLQIAINKVLHEGKVIELSWYGPRETTISLGGDFHYGRKQIISSQVSHIPVHKSGHFNFRSRKQIVFNLLQDINMDRLLNKTIPFNEAPEVYNHLRKGNIKEIGILFQYQ